MNINTDSWHYKYRGIREFQEPDNLCQYVRQMVYITVLIPLMALTLLAGTWMLTAPLWQFIFNASPALVFISGVTDIIILSVLWKTYRDANPELFKNKKPKGIIGVYIEAQHRKICPLIEYDQ